MASTLDGNTAELNRSLLLHMGDPAFRGWLSSVAEADGNPADWTAAERTVRGWLSSGRSLDTAYTLACDRDDIRLASVVWRLTLRESDELIETAWRVLVTCAPPEYPRYRAEVLARRWNRLPLETKFCLDCGGRRPAHRQKFCSDECGERERARRKQKSRRRR